MNQKSIVLTLAGLLAMFSAGLIFATNQAAADTFGKLAFGALTAFAPVLADLQRHIVIHELPLRRPGKDNKTPNVPNTQTTGNHHGRTPRDASPKYASLPSARLPLPPTWRRSRSISAG